LANSNDKVFKIAHSILLQPHANLRHHIASSHEYLQHGGWGKYSRHNYVSVIDILYIITPILKRKSIFSPYNGSNIQRCSNKLNYM